MGRIYDSWVRDHMLHSSNTHEQYGFVFKQKKGSQLSLITSKIKLFLVLQKKNGSTCFPYKYAHMEMDTCISYIQCRDLQILLIGKRNRIWGDLNKSSRAELTAFYHYKSHVLRLVPTSVIICNHQSFC